MKQSQGYTRLGWTLVSLVLLALFVFLLGRALQMLPMGVAYAVWTGIGAVGTVLAGWLLFNETLGAASIFGVALVLSGIVVLKLAHG
jgi:quaternary ammonium compound-resistance protein SugE